jgi:hypothetical protein
MIVREIAMKVLVLTAGALLPLTAVALAQSKVCDGQVVTRTGPNGKVLTLCNDGKYSSCVRDGQKLGYSYASAKRYCDWRKAAGFVR